MKAKLSTEQRELSGLGEMKYKSGKSVMTAGSVGQCVFSQELNCK